MIKYSVKTKRKLAAIFLAVVLSVAVLGWATKTLAIDLPWWQDILIRSNPVTSVFLTASEAGDYYYQFVAGRNKQEYIDTLDKHIQLAQESADAGIITPAEADKLIAAANNAKTGVEKDFTDGAKSQELAPTYEVLGNVIGWIFYYIVYGLGWILNQAIWVLTFVMRFPFNINSIEGINKGWSTVRDFCNNFFIVILLVISLGTILRLPRYQYKEILPKLLLMAVMINFSKMFAGIMIDFSQIIMLTFANAFTQLQAGNALLTAIGLPDLYKLVGGDSGGSVLTSGLGTAAKNDSSIKIWDILAALIFALIITVVALVVITMICIMLVFRLVMLMFYVVLAPIAFLGYVIPNGQKYWSQWWGDMTKYLTFGPVMVFFLWLSLTMMSAGTVTQGQPRTYVADQIMISSGVNIDDKGVSVGKDLGAPELKTLSEMATPKGIFNFLLVIGLLVGSLIMGQQSGVAGSKFASAGMGKLDKWRKKATTGLAIGAGKRAVGSKAVSGTLGRIANTQGLRLIPGMGAAARFAGAQRQQLQAGKAKKQQARVSAMTSARNMKNLNEQQLIRLAQESLDKNTQIAAAQELAGRGLLRDDPRLNAKQREDRIKVINKTRGSLVGNEDLLKTFDENIVKFSPGFALESSMFTNAGGQIDLEKVKAALVTGKLDIKNLMGSISEQALDQLDLSLKASGDGGIGQFLINNAKDDEELKKTFGAMSSVTKKMVVEGKKQKRDASGKALRGADGKVIWEEDKEASQISYNTFMDKDGSFDEDKRKRYLKSGGDITRAFDLDNLPVGASRELAEHLAQEQKRATDYAKKNTSDVIKNLDADKMNKRFMDVFGGIFSDKNLDDFRDRGAEFGDKLKEALAESAKGFDFAATKIEAGDSEEAKEAKRKKLKDGEKLYKRALMAGNEIDYSGASGDQKTVADESFVNIIKRSSSQELAKMKGLSEGQINAAAWHMPLSTVRSLAVSGENNELLGKIIERIEYEAVHDDKGGRSEDDKQRAKERADKIKKIDY